MRIDSCINIHHIFTNLEHILDPEPLFRGPQQQNASETIKNGLDQV